MDSVLDSKQTYLENFYTIDKSKIINSCGINYLKFKNNLLTNFVVVWRDIFLGYLALIITAYVLIKFERSFAIPLSLVGVFLFGYTHAYIHLFFHEAAHGNIAKNRKLNDFLANIFIGIFIGQDIKNYRIIHFKHHRTLGSPEDTERTYFDALNVRFILESLTGLKVFKVILRRKKIKNKEQSKKIYNKQIIFGLMLHLIILALALKFNHWVFAIAWVFGIGIAMPFFGATRQLLEHRDLNANSKTNYEIVHHGVINRLFGDSLLARTFGGAGFNRHLLHHWEPQLSYTQLRNLEKFLLDTNVASLIRSFQTTYTSTFITLLRAP